MEGNSFPTKEGTRVSGTVAMALDEGGRATPIKAETPIGTVNVDPMFVEKVCRALGAHAAIVTGKDVVEVTRQIIAASEEARS